MSFAWFTAGAAVIVTVSLALYEWRKARRPPGQEYVSAHAPLREDRQVHSHI